MINKIRVSELKNVCVFYKGDVYDLALLLLKINDAKDKGTNSTSRHTIKGLAVTLALISNKDCDEVEKVFKRYNLPFGATVEHDKDVK